MKTQAVHVEVQIPSVDDFVRSYPHYAAVRAVERDLFELVVTPENFLAADAVTERLGMPAVSAVADMVAEHCRTRGGLTGFQKQLTGAVVCALMQANGYAKTGTKRSIARPGWSRGEVYRR